MRINKLIYLPVIAFFAFTLMGCPYSSEIAMSEKGEAVSDGLLGTWELSGETKDIFLITKTSGTTFDILKTSASDGSTTLYHGHLTNVNGTTFLNVKEDGEYSSYYFYKMVKEGEFKITLAEVTENIKETFTSSADFKKFVQDNMNNSYFFTKDADQTYYKVK